MLECHGLTKVYEDNRKALEDVNFSVETNGIFALIGRNGAGKTTLIRILATELEPTAGSASINNIDVLKQEGQLREKIAIVPQEARAIRWMTPKQIVASYLLWRGYGYGEANRLAEQSLAKLGLKEYANVLTSKLSGGMKRKVLLATVTASEAEIIFLDEPTTGLDPISRRELWDILRSIGKERFIFLTTHYLEEAEQLADKIGILNNGQLVAIGTLAEIRKSAPYQYSLKLSQSGQVPIGAAGEVTTDSYGRAQIMTNEEEAFRLAKLMSEQGIKFSINPVTLDDVFFYLVRPKSEGRAVKRSKLSQILAGVLVNAVYEMKNYPVVLISTVISPLSLLAVVTFVSKGALFGTAIEGGLIMTFFSSGIAMQSDLSHLKNDFKLQDMVVSSPTSARVYMGGMAFAEIVYSLPSIIILILLEGLFLHPSLLQIAILSIVLLVMFAISVALGFMLSTFRQTWSKATLSQDFFRCFLQRYHQFTTR